MKKLSFLVALATFLSFSAFAEFNVSIYNELGTDTVHASKGNSKSGIFYDEMDITFSHEKVKARIDAFALLSPEDKDLSVMLFDWYETIHALNFLDVSLNDKIRSSNSKFSIRWEDISFAKIGCEGASATLVWDKLRVNVGIPFQNFSSDQLSVSTGVCYDILDDMQVSATAEKKDDSFAGGVFFSSKWFNLGYGYNYETLGLYGSKKHILVTSTYPVFGGFEPGLEFAADFDGNFYGAFQANYRVLNFLIRSNVQGNYVGDVLTYQVEGGLSYFFKDHHEICAKIRLNLTDDNLDMVSVPIYWAYFF